MNYFIGWEEQHTKRWEIVAQKDWKRLAEFLLLNPDVESSTIFVVPTTSIMGGIWLDPSKHASAKIDFSHFFDEYSKESVVLEREASVQKSEETMKVTLMDAAKYGFVSPDGRYFPCLYQGHGALAEKICFGLVDTNNPELYLENHGWCKIYKPYMGRDYAVYVGKNFCLTDEQMKCLKKYGLEHAEKISSMMEKRG